MAEHDDLDRLLDAALSTYADSGPNLAPRVLTALSTTRARRMRWFWAAGLATAAAVAVLLFIAQPRAPKPLPAQQTQAAIAPPSAPAIPAETPHAVTRIAHRTARPRISAAPTPPPKQDAFPTPHPLSAEEQSLAHLVAQSSQDERHTLLAAQQQADAPIRISAISIPPLAPPDQGKE